MSATIPRFAVRYSGTRTIDGRSYDCPTLVAHIDDEAAAIQIAQTESNKRAGKLITIDSSDDENFSVVFLNGKRL